MDNLEDFIKNLNPEESDGKPPLFYGAKYRCFRNGQFIGIYTWTQDDIVGDSFQRTRVVDGESEIEVAVPDGWELLPDSEQ